MKLCSVQPTNQHEGEQRLLNDILQILHVRAGQVLEIRRDSFLELSCVHSGQRLEPGLKVRLEVDICRIHNNGAEGLQPGKGFLKRLLHRSFPLWAFVSVEVDMEIHIVGSVTDRDIGEIESGCVLLSSIELVMMSRKEKNSVQEQLRRTQPRHMRHKAVGVVQFIL